MLKTLAFDYGASSGRGIIGEYDGQKLKLNDVHRFSNNPVMIGNTLYWDVLNLFSEMKKGIAESIKLYGKDIKSIGVDTWGVDFGLLNKKGKLIGNPVHYRDDRTKGMIKKADSIIGKENIYKTTGIAFQKFNTLYQLMAMREKEDCELNYAKNFLFMPDLFRYFLTGEKTCEYTIASTSQMLDAKKRNWAYNMLKKLDIPVEMFGEIIEPGVKAGKLTKELADEFNIDQITVSAVAQHDTASAVVAVPAKGDKYAYLSSGTWSLLGAQIKSPILTDKAHRLNYTNEGGYDNTIRMLKNIMGLWIFQECRRHWNKKGAEYSFDELEMAAQKEAKPFSAFINPNDDIFYAPGKMPEKIQQYLKETGQKVLETKAEITRCVMESLALEYRKALEGLEDILGYKIPVLNIVGGGCKNIMLCKYAANAIKRPVIAGPVEATATGNILCQLMALKELSGLNEAREVVKNSFDVNEYLPHDTDAWDEAYERFKKL